MPPFQRSFDDPGTALRDVTFCVIDVETTGTSPVEGGLTEIGAVKLRGGECLGTFSTLVDPGRPIAGASALTGINGAMVRGGPSVAAVLPSLLEFAGGTVLVGHNVRFDLSFLGTALESAGHAPLAHPVVDTCALARRLVGDEVLDCRLATLAAQFRLPHRPIHRALADALATADLLHVLLERAASLSVLGLDDLLALPTVSRRLLGKLRLIDGLPRAPGVYLFRDAAGRVLYVGKAANLRARVRSSLSGDDGRQVGQLLREAVAVDHLVTAGDLEAAVLQVRLVHRHRPRFNLRTTTRRRARYVKLTLGGRFPRLAVVQRPKGDGGVYLGPLPGAAVARRVAGAIESAAAELDEAYLVGRTVHGLAWEPGLLLEALERRAHAHAVEARFHEAAAVRDGAIALAAALRRQWRIDGLRRAGRLVLVGSDRRPVELIGGCLARTWDEAMPDQHQPPLPGTPAEGPLPAWMVDEVACVASWLEREAGRLRVLSCEGELSWPVRLLPQLAWT